MYERTRIHARDIDRIVERQMRNWELARSQHLTVPPAERPEVAEFIAISRMVGAGASETAALLAERLGWPRFDKEILAAMTGDDAIRSRIYASLDERDVSWWEDVVRPIVEPQFAANDYFRRLVRTTVSLARQGSAVFLGRGIDLMLPRSLGLRVRIVAPLEARVERFAQRHELPLPQAREEVLRIDRERAEFIERHFRRRIDDPTRCDLTVNTEHFSPAQAAEVILAARASLREAPQAADAVQ